MLLALRSSLTRVPARFGTRGFASTTENLVLTELDETSGIAKVTLNNGPVNSLSLEMYVHSELPYLTLTKLTLTCHQAQCTL